MKKTGIHVPAPLALLALLVAALLAGCAEIKTVSPKENITGTYELAGFSITTTGPAQPSAAQDTASMFYTNLKLGATTTEKDVASYSGTLKVGPDTWNRQITINGKGNSETGTYSLSYTGPNNALMTIETPAAPATPSTLGAPGAPGGKSTRKITFTGKRTMSVDYPVVSFPDGSTIHEIYTWKKVSDKL